MITATLSVLLLIRVVLLILVSSIFLIGAGLGWIELKRGDPDNLTLALVRFSFWTGLSFSAMALIALSETVRIHFNIATIQLITSALAVVSLVALINVAVSGFKMAQELLFNGNVRPDITTAKEQRPTSDPNQQ
jgi:hypothetical protein